MSAASPSLRRARPAALLALWGLLASLAPASGGQAADPQDPIRAALEARRPGAWELYSSAPLGERRHLALWLRRAAGPADLEGLIGAVALEPDPAARAALVGALGTLVPLEAEPAARRASALAERAHLDPDPEARAAALAALGQAGGHEAAAWLERLLDLLPPGEAPAAARALAGLGAGRGAVRARVLAATAGLARDPGSDALPPSVGILAALLPTYGRDLAERGIEVATPRERTPLTRALRHPSPELARAGEAALAALLGRLLVLRQAEGAERLLADLAREGLDPAVAHLRRARLILSEGLDAERALGAAEEIDRRPSTLGAAGDDPARVRARHLAGIALVALDRPAEAAAKLESAAALQDALLAQRVDLFGEGGAREHEERLHARAGIELSRAVAALARGRAASDRAVLEPLRLAHELELEAQALAARADGRELNHWDVLLRGEFSPHALLFSRPGERWPLARSHDLQRELGRALASVARGEFPGFAPVPGTAPELADPVADPRRARRLLGILDGRLARVRRELGELRREVFERDGPEGLREAEVQDRMRLLLYERSEYERWKLDLPQHASKLRTPTRLALSLAGDLLGDGRSGEARALAQALLDDLEAGERAQLWAEELAAQTELLIGSTWMQDDEPGRAREALESAVERYENLERTLAERGADEGLLASMRRERAGALMSLAVNTNVREGRPERALEYFERAYELRQDDFMRVLLACYRARMGRAEEARRVLAEVQIAPPLYYNLACTHALLGEAARALEFLELDFATNHDSEGSLEQQQRWAARDPDLTSLRQDPRFRWLLGAAAEDLPPEGDGGRGDGRPR